MTELPLRSGTDDIADMVETLAERESGSRRSIPMTWPRISEASQFLKPGTVGMIAGPPGTGKSFFAAEIAMAVHRDGAKWKYLPLEDSKQDFKWRLLAMMCGNYRVIDDSATHSELSRRSLEKHAAELDELIPHICENPRVGHKDSKGNVVVPKVDHRSVIDWIRRALEEPCRVLFIDPLSQINFPSKDRFAVEEEFVQDILALAKNAAATVIIVAHSVKHGAPGTSDLGRIQGSAAFSRLSHSVIMLEPHEPKKSSVYRIGGATEEVEHNRTIVIAKSRCGHGTGQRLAFVQGAEAPSFDEMGFIVPCVAKKSRESRNEDFDGRF